MVYYFAIWYNCSALSWAREAHQWGPSASEPITREGEELMDEATICYLMDREVELRDRVIQCLPYAGLLLLPSAFFLLFLRELFHKVSLLSQLSHMSLLSLQSLLLRLVLLTNFFLSTAKKQRCVRENPRGNMSKWT